MFVCDWIKLQLKSLRNSFKEDRKAFLLKDLWHTAILFVGLLIIYIFLQGMFDFIVRKGFSPFDFAFMLLSFSLLVFLPLVFYSAIITSLTFLFQEEEIHFYFSLPINRLSVFTVKFLQTYFHTNWMIFLGLLTFLFTFQTYFKATPLIYLTGSFAFLIFLMIPVCLAIIVVILISCIFPFVQAKGILTVIGLLVGSILVTAIRVMQPEQLITAEGKMRLVTIMQNLHKPWMTLLPSEWVTNAIFAQTQNDVKAVLLNLISLLTLALILLALVYFLAKLFYKRIWANSVVLPSLGYKRFAWQILLRLFPKSLREFIRKDLISFYRDTIEKGSLLILIPLSFVYLYSIFVLNRQLTKTGPAHQMFSFLYIYIFNLFYSSIVISGLSGRWVFPSLSSEGNNFKLIKGSPVLLKDFLKAKFLLGFIPLLILGEFLILSSCLILNFPVHFTLISAVSTAILCWGITLISLTLGILQADFSIKTPVEFALSMKGFVCLVWQMLFAGLVVTCVGIPSAVFISYGLNRIFLISSIVSLLVILATLIALDRRFTLSIKELAKKPL